MRYNTSIQIHSHALTCTQILYMTVCHYINIVHIHMHTYVDRERERGGGPFAPAAARSRSWPARVSAPEGPQAGVSCFLDGG